MELTGILLAVLLVAAIVACVVAVWGIRELVMTARSVKAFADDTRERLNPLLEKAEVTVDAANIELLRVDAIIGKVEDATDRFEKASDRVNDVVSAPSNIVNDVATRVRRAWKDRHREAEGRGPHV